MLIDIGNEAIDRDSWLDYNTTIIDGVNPANASGRLTSVSIYTSIEMLFTIVVVFYRPDPTGYPNKFTARDSQGIGTVPFGFSNHNIDLEVEEGDYIGIYCVTQGRMDVTSTGGLHWHYTGNKTDVTNYDFGAPGTAIISLCASGFTITVTTQAATDVLSTSVTGNGNITYISGENPHTRGFCYMEGTSGDPTTANSKVFDNGEGSYGVGAYTKAITGLTKGTGYRVRAYVIDSAGTTYGDTVQFTTDEEPTVTTQAVSEIGDVTAIGNGNITDLGGDTPTKRGICYNTTGSPTVADSKTEETGEFETGAFTETLINLSPETHYYAKAYAMNAVGYSYGAEVEFTTHLVEYIGYGEGDEGGADSDGWVKFITAAEGVIPTGTRKVICSDYSGCTYRTQASETDDGAEYVAYFVISTDLTPDKSSLAYYKRILDLHLYFKNEISGMVKVEVKRDSEPAWQEVGEVTLTGIEEILIKHLAPDIKAKHFLFKLSATNKFKFLGCLYEFLLEGDR